jgi:hypothetical protein
VHAARSVSRTVRGRSSSGRHNVRRGLAHQHGCRRHLAPPSRPRLGCWPPRGFSPPLQPLCPRPPAVRPDMPTAPCKGGENRRQQMHPGGASAWTFSWGGLTAARRLGRVRSPGPTLCMAVLLPTGRRWIGQPQSGPGGAAHERSAGVRRPR